jgi:hypothetical protein
VRGYEEREITGDSGAVATVELDHAEPARFQGSTRRSELRLLACRRRQGGQSARHALPRRPVQLPADIGRHRRQDRLPDHVQAEADVAHALKDAISTGSRRHPHHFLAIYNFQ